MGAYGDAGAIVTSDDRLAKKARMLVNHGRIDKYNHEMEGINSRMDGLQAAILGVKLKYLPQWTEQRRENAYTYNECLKDSALVLPAEMDRVKAVYHLYVVRVPAGQRRHMMDYLKSKAISSGIHYPIALPYLKAYKYLNHTEDDFPHAAQASQECVSLPMFPELQESQIRYISDKIREFLDTTGFETKGNWVK
ncbi:unnamed protein product [marine sediment metagenome]|uniref:DegT/DnrJ/EryC1/StrS aminotransferase n=1 Tax=marine sediment metagenome TaxID=412755 RepID=X0YDV0_9ZZZZ